MSIAEDKKLQSSDRFVLVRMEPARYINDDLVLTGGSTYSATFQDINNISKIQRNGADLTLVETITGDDEYTFDEDSGLLTMQLASAPDEDSNVVILFHYLYLTTVKGRYFPSDPLTAKSTSNPVRFWEPRVARTPQIEESYNNIINAVMTIKASSIQINNADRYLNPFTGLNDSFKNKTIQVYIGINDSLDTLFTGPMNDISLSDDRATVRFRDSFSLINNIATFGGPVSASTYTNAGYSLLDPSKVGAPKIMNLGRGSPGRYKDTDKIINVTGTTPDKKYAQVDSFNHAINVEYNATDLTQNRHWHVFRTRVPIEIQALSGLVRQTTSTIRGDTVHHYFFTSHNLSVGQTFEWDDGGGPYQAIVHHVGTHDIGGSDYNVMIANNGSINLTDPIMTDINDFTPNNCMTVALVRPGATANSTNFTNVFLKEGTEWDLINLFSGNGLKEYRVDLDSSIINWDPEDGDFVLYQCNFDSATLSESPSHGGTVSNLLTRAGISINEASFTAADSALDMDVRLQVPLFGSSGIPTYRALLEEILGSSLTYLSQNNDGEAVYGILEAVGSGDTRDENLILSGSQSVTYGYNDIYQTIRYKNVHDNYQNDEDAPVDLSNSKSEYLHGEDRVLEFSHVLNDFSDRSDAHIALRSSRQATYSYDVATEDIDSDLGDDVTIESDKITPTGTKNVKITSIKRSADKVQVKATDLGDLE